MLKTTSVLLGICLCSMSYAAAKNTTNGTGGSFKYVEPTGGYFNGKCPSPYDPLRIVLINNTDPANFASSYNANANAIWVNIYYVGLDNRPYYGDYLGYNAEKNTPTFPAEVKGVPSPSGDYYFPIKNSDVSGPIVASTYYSADPGVLSGGTYPARSWSYSPGGTAPKGYEGYDGGTVQSGQSYDDLVKDSRFGSYTKVFTITGLTNGSDQMDYKGQYGVTLPMRSFSRIRIDVRVGLDKNPVNMTSNNSANAVSAIVARWEAHAVNDNNGTVLIVDRSWVKTTIDGNITTAGGNKFADDSMKESGTINILPADALVINMKGSWKFTKNSDGSTSSKFFDGSKITLNRLKIRQPTETDGRPMSSASAQPLVTCD